jgi:hypothetical protein
LTVSRLRWPRPPLCHPERSRIPSHVALDTSRYASLSKERHMKFASANKFNRNSEGIPGICSSC